MKRLSQFLTLLVLAGLFALFGLKVSNAAPTFTQPGFVDETLYQGNGMITMRFDPAGRLWVLEKQGRVLVFEPNPGGPSSYNYDYYEVPGTVVDLPDLSTLTPVTSGTVNTFTLAPRLRNDNFIMRFVGTINIPTTGTYTFYLQSDDDSRLFIDDNLIVNLPNNGSANGSVTLTAGTHNIRVEYLEIAGGENLTVTWSGPGFAQTPVPQGVFKQPSVFVDFASQVNTDGERGAMGLALDPNFASNRYVYVQYATNTDARLVRYTSNTTFTAAEAGSALTLLSGLPNANSVHKAGDIHFHPNDPNNIYVALGDDGERYIVDNLDNYYGKILKVNKTNGQGLTDNPYYNGSLTSVRSRIWSAKYRNPYRFAFDPVTNGDYIYVSENGDGVDRIVRMEKGGDGAWPTSDYLTDSPDGKRKIFNTSAPSRTGVVIFRSGPFAVNGQPTLYSSRYGGGDRNVVNRWTLSGTNGNVATPVAADGGQAFYRDFQDHGIVSFTAGPDGALYYTDSGQGASTGTTWRLGRIRQTGSTAPVADFTYTPSTGQSPLAVTFTDTSTAPGSSITSRQWNFGDGTTSTATNPSKTFTQPGTYSVSLTVTNASGVTNTKTVSITVYHAVTLTLTGQINDGRTVPGSALAAATELRFYQRNGTTPLAVSGGTGANGNIRAIAAGGVINLTVTAQITGNGIVVSAGESTTDGVQHAFVGIPLSTSAGTQSASANFHLSDTLLRGKALDTKGAPAQVDIGLSRVTAGAYYAIAGGRDFLGGSGIPASGQAHRVVADGLGYYHMPIRTGGGGATFHLDTAADTLVNSHGKAKSSTTVAAGTAVVRDLTIGLYNGGTGETDLSGIAVTPNVDFASQIQAIFTNSCIGCHTDTSDNSFDLDLQSGAAFGELVDHESGQAPGVLLVQRGSAERSYLMEKINAIGGPQVGTSMRPGDPMPVAERALIRDWINQLTPNNPSAPPVITSGTTKVGTVGGALTYQISATNTPTSFNATGLPPGLSVNATTGLISGTPSSGGTYNVLVSATNTAGTGTRTIVFTISGGGSAPVITSAGTASGTVGAAFTYQITATNSPTSYGATGLPAGLSVNTATGAISGTPTAAGTTTATITATNGSGTGSASLAITVSAGGAAPSVTSAGTAGGTVGTAFNYQIAATNSPTSFNAIGLPAGLSVNTTNGVITGTPTAAGTTTATITATNASGTGSKSLVITINAAGGTNLALNKSVAVSGTQFPDGMLGGEAVDGNLGTRWSSAQQVNPQSIVVDLGQTSTITSVVLYWEAAGGRNYTVDASMDGTTWTNNIATVTGNTITGVTNPLTYVPSGSSTTARYVRVVGTERILEAYGYSLWEFQVFGTAGGGGAPVITSALTATGTVGSAFSYTITATNSPTSYSATGLPSGLSINTATGAITGTPTGPGTSNVTIGATNATGSDSKTLVLTVSPASGGTNLAAAKNAFASSTEFGVANNVTDGGTSGASRWGSVYAGDPAVANVQSIYVDLGAPTAFNKVTLLWEAAYGSSYKIQTSNTANGTDWVDVATMTGQNGGQDDITFSAVTARYVKMQGVTRGTGWGYSLYEFEVYNTGSGGTPPAINSALTASGTVGTAFSYTITATNSPTSYSATGLPSGLSLNTATGAITGTPTGPGTSNITIGAINASGADSKTLVLTVAAGGVTNLAPAGTATASSFEGANTVNNGKDGNTTSTRWAASSGTFPQWWKVDLGSNKSLSRADIFWFSPTSRSYKFIIETSTDDVNYNTVVDKSGNTTNGNTSDTFTATARYVRVTVTGSSAGWASAFEFQIFGQ